MQVVAVVVADGSSPSLSSTSSLTISVCACEPAAEPRSCRQGPPEPLLLSLLTPALLTGILTCTGKSSVYRPRLPRGWTQLLFPPLWLHFLFPV